MSTSDVRQFNDAQRWFSRASSRLVSELHVALEQSAQTVEQTAKDQIGHYLRPAPKPFDDWAELTDATKDDRERHNFPRNEPGLRTGNMRDSIKHRVKGHQSAVIGSSDPNLLWFDLGTIKQAPRAVLGPALIQSKQQIKQELMQALQNTFNR